jgi:hypothetical protein
MGNVNALLINRFSFLIRNTEWLLFRLKEKSEKRVSTWNTI